MGQIKILSTRNTMWHILEWTNKKMLHPIKFVAILHSAPKRGTDFIVEHPAFPDDRKDSYHFWTKQEGRYFVIYNLKKLYWDEQINEFHITLQWDQELADQALRDENCMKAIAKRIEFLSQQGFTEQFAQFVNSPNQRLQYVDTFIKTFDLGQKWDLFQKGITNAGAGSNPPSNVKAIPNQTSSDVKVSP